MDFQDYAACIEEFLDLGNVLRPSKSFIATGGQTGVSKRKGFKSPSAFGSGSHKKGRR